MADDKTTPARKPAPSKVYYRLDVDTLGYVTDQGVREEVTGKGKVFSSSDLHPNAVKRGVDTNALVKLSGKDGKQAADDAAAAEPDFENMTDDELLTAALTINPSGDRDALQAQLDENRDAVVEYVRDNYAAHP